MQGSKSSLAFDTLVIPPPINKRKQDSNAVMDEFEVYLVLKLAFKLLTFFFSLQYIETYRNLENSINNLTKSIIISLYM